MFFEPCALLNHAFSNQVFPEHVKAYTLLDINQIKFHQSF